MAVVVAVEKQKEEVEEGEMEEAEERRWKGGKKVAVWREREVPMSTPRRSFCFPPGDFGEFSRRRYYALFFLLPFIFQS